MLALRKPTRTASAGASDGDGGHDELPDTIPSASPRRRIPAGDSHRRRVTALQVTGLLSCVTTVFGCPPTGFYSLDTMLLEGVLRALAGLTAGLRA